MRWLTLTLALSLVGMSFAVVQAKQSQLDLRFALDRETLRARALQSRADGLAQQLEQRSFAAARVAEEMARLEAQAKHVKTIKDWIRTHDTDTSVDPVIRGALDWVRCQQSPADCGGSGVGGSGHSGAIGSTRYGASTQEQ